MTEDLRMIACVQGNLNTQLPEAAFRISYESGGIPITPCAGCQFKTHLERIAKIAEEIARAKTIGVALKQHEKHAVLVFEHKERLHVRCTCRCCTEVVKEE